MISALLPAAIAALAAWLALGGPGDRLRVLGAEPPRRLPVVLVGRPGAPPGRHRAAVGVLAGIAVALLLGGIFGFVTGAVVALAATLALGFLAPAPDTAALVRELPEALEFLAVSLEAGQPMSSSVRTVADVSPPATRTLLGRVAAHLALGRAGPLAWDELRGHEVWSAVAADIARAEQSGTSLTATLRMHADDARQERRDLAAKRARAIGVRSVVPLMACFLPAFVLVGVVPIVISLVRDFFG